MNTRPDKHPDQATDIINDKEMEELIQQLVKKAHDAGMHVTNLNKAISSIWKETFCVNTSFEKLSANEEAFAKKIQKFLAHYERQLENHYYLLEKSSYPSFNKDSLYIFLLSMYGVFENEGTISKDSMITFAKKYGLNSYFYGFKNDIYFLYTFILHLSFSSATALPTYFLEAPSSNILIQDDYKNFAKKFQLSNHACRTASMVIWVIKKYF